MTNLILRDNIITFPDTVDLTKLQEKFDLLIVVSKLSGYEVKLSVTLPSINTFYNLDIISSDNDYAVEFMFSKGVLTRVSFLYNGIFKYSGSELRYYYESDDIDGIMKQIGDLIEKL